MYVAGNCLLVYNALHPLSVLSCVGKVLSDNLA